MGDKFNNIDLTHISCKMIVTRIIQRSMKTYNLKQLYTKADVEKIRNSESYLHANRKGKYNPLLIQFVANPAILGAYIAIVGIVTGWVTKNAYYQKKMEEGLELCNSKK